MDRVQHHKVYVVDGARTPFLKARGKQGPFSASDLALQAGRSLLMRQTFRPTDLDEVIMGCVMPSPDETNVARIIALRLGCGKRVPAWTVQRNCASGMQAIDAARLKIMTGESDLILAGGTEAMSRAPVLFRPEMVDWLGLWQKARSFSEKIGALKKLQLRFLAPVIGILRGLTDPVVGLSMGQTAENLAWRFGISREEMDAFSIRSHQRLASAIEQKRLSEIVPIISPGGDQFVSDDGVRGDSTMEQLAGLRAVFDRKFGLVTAGNSAQITDGAALLLLASRDAVERYGLSVMGTIDDVNWAGLDPAQMGLGPAYSISPMLQRNKIGIDDIDAWEINEAFAVQVQANLLALQDGDFCRDELGLDQPFGKIPQESMNRDGGAIAVGHPVGASGARIVLHLLHTLRERGGERGVASLCIGGGQGGATLVTAGDQL